MYKKVLDQQKAGSFPNVATIRDEGEILWVQENVNDILVRQENQYQGWFCWAGHESMMIDSQGNVFVATCRAEKLGNIYEEFELPTEPIVCPKAWCGCAADLNTSKAKNLEAATYLRRMQNDD